MNEYNENIQNHLNLTKELTELPFEDRSDGIREQIMKNRTCINSFQTWMKDYDFDHSLLLKLKSTQIKLIEHFEINWTHKVENYKGLLHFNKVYSNEAWIYEEHHGGIKMQHLFKNYIIFREDGFFNWIVTKENNSPDKIANELKNSEKNYNYQYEMDFENEIKFEAGKIIFDGKVHRDCLKGKTYTFNEHTGNYTEEGKEIYSIL